MMSQTPATSSLSQKVDLILNIYELTNTFPGLVHLGLYHTGLAAFPNESEGIEYSFSTEGIRMTEPKYDLIGHWRTSIPLGTLNISIKEAHTIIRKLDARFHRYNYDILFNNCNHFTDVAAKCLLHGSSCDVSSVFSFFRLGNWSDDNSAGEDSCDTSHIGSDSGIIAEEVSTKAAPLPPSLEASSGEPPCQGMDVVCGDVEHSNGAERTKQSTQPGSYFCLLGY